ncbi:hypothetical protein DWB77_00132 [Streptomyces hundungensis]|uniref:Uncharacterized protein n=1 Tax=Streptomyces hundungensis TaxID=1077946 RepID=A0A387H2Y6_9ACTN|nr:hypothetical protein [Streptomyces hundungensis]AYG78025.1 hypothetical protein DWB77_00132 [Streptomyces hundungensis]
MLDRFTQFCVQALPPSGPDITAVEPWQGDDAPAYGIAVTFSSGSRLWLQITGGLAPGAQAREPSTPASAPVPVPLPALFDETGTVSPLRAEAYLTAALTHTDNTEIARAYGYSNRPGQTAQHPRSRRHLPQRNTPVPAVRPHRQGRTGPRP